MPDAIGDPDHPEVIRYVNAGAKPVIVERNGSVVGAVQVGSDDEIMMITDAGTPLISDPGFRVVRACRRAGVRVSPMPGPCAVSAALSVGGLPTDRFQFVGFPPSRSTARRAWLGALAATPHTLVLYESPHRLADTLADPDAAIESVARREPLINKAVEKERLMATLQDEMNHPELAETGLGNVDPERFDKAIALAGGLTDRASRRKMFVLKAASEKQRQERVSMGSRIHPGDIISIQEGFF